ncbi:Uncharacterised protein [Shigella sonnei]|nr:Uncharacterised protein [Shigella sonnei]
MMSLTLTHHLVSEITAHIASRSTDFFIFLGIHGLQGIQCQFGIHHRISPSAAPSPAGRCGCSSGGISQVIGAFSGIRLWTW